MLVTLPCASSWLNARPRRTSQPCSSNAQQGKSRGLWPYILTPERWPPPMPKLMKSEGLRRGPHVATASVASTPSRLRATRRLLA